MKLVRFILKNAAAAHLPKLIEHYSKYSPSPLSIKQFIDFGTVNACERTSFAFLRHELPVRLANIMREISLLPDQLLSTTSVQLVQSWYVQSFLEMLEYEGRDPNNHTNLKNFLDTLITIRNRHNDVVPTMAQGVVEYRGAYGGETSTVNIQYFLDRFYLSRISIRMLINQHTLIFGDDANPVSSQNIGSIDPACNVMHVVQDAHENAKLLCEQYYLVSPEIKIIQHNAQNKGKPIEVVYVPSHLYHMLFELFKNAMRATIERHDNEGHPLLPVEVYIVLGKEDLTIKINDQGGGVPLRKIEQLFDYMYSSAPQPDMNSSRAAPLAGLGHGLPLSRLYARYFQGNIHLHSLEGHGTDAVLYLKALCNESYELLPVYNKSVQRHYCNNGNQENGDWSVPSREPRDMTVHRHQSASGIA
uniref:pyruvate dehydrogenase (acetyl-transferring) kinase isozyme 2, mitochondrial-like n=1 Tax=Myxine glutinosa TaxID=7769 RepID=UPI00358EC040